MSKVEEHRMKTTFTYKMEGIWLKYKAKTDKFSSHSCQNARISFNTFFPVDMIPSSNHSDW